MPSETLGIAGSGAIAQGLARLAAEHGGAVLWARSEESAAKVDFPGIEVTTDVARLAQQSFVVEAIVEELDAKAELLAAIGATAPDDTVITTTTSSLSIADLGDASGRPDRFAAIHVFNPVDQMDLVELAFADAASEDTRTRAVALAESLGKTPVEVPDWPGFVVNRLLFPFLFEAVKLAEHDRLDHEAVDKCMKLGAAHPMGPFRLLDFVGIDVAVAIGEQLDVEVPQVLRGMVAEGKLGRKSGAGFYEY